jgi:hypothetical protein
MIEGLTEVQQNKMVKCRQKYFDQVISTSQADRYQENYERAAKAIRRLAELKGLELNEIVWVSRPQEGAEKYQASWDSLGDSLGGSFKHYLRDSLRGSLWYSLKYPFNKRFGDSLWDSLWGFLRESLWDSLKWPLRDSLRDYLWDSLWDSFRDTGPICFCTFIFDDLNFNIETRDWRYLNCINEILASCFSIWVIPGGVILCERPKSVEVEDGKLINAEW